MKKKDFLHLFSIIAVSILLFVFVISFFFKPFRIDGKSMEPLFQQGDIVFVKRLFYRIDRNEVVVVKMHDQTYVVKRVLAIEGDRIDYKDGEIFVNGENRGKITSGDYRMFFDNSSFIVEKNSFFILGDNRSSSIDSRFWGSISKDMIYGKVVFNLFSFLRKEGVA
ncbi:MAG: signal peptidase I [Acidobacteriota bacterium]